MVEMLPESMGYDRAIIVFSPDGRLFQVEYAREAVKRGATAVGIVFKDGVIFGARKRETPLIKPSEKIFQVDEHIASAASGLVADARVLVDEARVKAQQQRVVFDEATSVHTMAKFIADKQQLYTQYAGVRPYGVSFIIGGVDGGVSSDGGDGGPRLFETDPAGVLVEIKARAIGTEAEKINELFSKKWKPGMTLKDAVQLAIDGIGKEGKIAIADITIVTVTKDGYRELREEDLKSLGVSA